MKQCVVQVQSQHHLDVIIGRVRSLGGALVYTKYLDIDNSNVYAQYTEYLRLGLPAFIKLDAWDSLRCMLYNHNCCCEVFHTVQDAIEYLGLSGSV